MVDDERFIREVLADFLRMEGYQVWAAEDGEAASQLLSQHTFEVVITDLKMPNKGGLDLLKEISVRSPQAITIVMTGYGTVETAIDAMKRGAHDYVLKPFKVERVLDIIRSALDAQRSGVIQRPRFEASQERKQLAERFDRVMDTLWLAYHPIVNLDGSTYGYEALMRSEEPSLGDPNAVLNAAENLDQVHRLGRRIRQRAIEGFEQAPAAAHLFVNLHPTDLLDPELFSAAAPLSKQAKRVVLEITERASLQSLTDVPGRVASLRAMGFRVAIDDLGAGYAGLGSFTELEPDIVKLDMSLVRGVHLNLTKEKVILSMMSLARDLGTQVIAEGVETEEERNKLEEIGCSLLQGFYFARPARLAR